jgi:hypothetical protein
MAEDRSRERFAAYLNRRGYEPMYRHDQEKAALVIEGVRRRDVSGSERHFRVVPQLVLPRRFGPVAMRSFGLLTVPRFFVRPEGEFPGFIRQLARPPPRQIPGVSATSGLLRTARCIAGGTTRAPRTA